MRIFLTGATGFVGSAIVPELLGAGHRVIALARSDESARALLAAGAEVHRGDLADLESLRAGAAASDGVVHAAFDHDFSRFAETCEADRRAIETMGEALAGSERPFIVTSGLPLVPERPATEDDALPAGPGDTPRVSEQAAMAMVEHGVRASVVRMSQAHDRDRQGLATYLIGIAREKGVSAYVGDGLNRWPAVHRLDAATLYRLALEQGSAGTRYHAVAEEGVPLRQIAESIGRGLKLPVTSLAPDDAAAHFGGLAFPVGMDVAASGALTRERLGWRPMDRSGFLADLDRSSAFREKDHP